MTAILTDLCKTKWPKRLKRSPSPQRRSWWRTPTAARSLSASPWCLCRSRCHRASTYSTSPGVDKELDKHLATGWRSRRCLAATGCSLSLIQEHANKRSLKLIVPLLNLSPGRPRNISLKSRWDLLHINFTPRSRICWKWESYTSTESSFSHYCFFILTWIIWKRVLRWTVKRPGSDLPEQRGRARFLHLKLKSSAQK